MLDVILTRGLPLDRITTTDVWATETISANLPPVEQFKARMDQWIWDKYKIEVEHLCARNSDGSKKTYEQMFYHVPKRRSQVVQAEREQIPARINSGLPGFVESVVSSWTQAESPCTESRGALPDFRQTPDTTGVRSSRLWKQGTIKGFPLASGVTYCQKLKVRAFSKEPATTGKDKNIVEYLGIAADEPKRFGQLSEKKRAPLVEFGIDEDLCGLYCHYNGILSPIYETSCRDGCWFCHNQGVDQLRQLRKKYPDHWALLLRWDKDSPVTFKASGHTVHDYDRRFEMEDDGLICAEDRNFRWNMLDEELNYRWF